MIEFWQAQLDYIYFVYGLAFILLGVVCFLVRDERQNLAWRWLGLFGLTHGLSEWLDLFALSFGDTGVWFAAVRVALLTGSFLCLVEFGRQGTGVFPGPRLGARLYALLLFLVGCGWLVGSGLDGLLVFSRYFCGLPGGLWAAVVLFSQGLARRRKNGYLTLAGLAMFSYALATGLVVPGVNCYPSLLLNQDIFFQAAKFPVQLLRGALAAFLSFLIYQYYRASGRHFGDLPGDDVSSRFGLKLALILSGVLLGGWLVTQVSGLIKENDERALLMYQARIAATVVHPEMLNGLIGVPAGQPGPEARLLRAQLQTMRSADQRLRRVRLIIVQNGNLSVAVDSTPENSGHYTAPGALYADAPAGLAQVFEDRQARIIGPYTDHGGRFVSGFAPLRDPGTGRILAVLGLDSDAGEWRFLIVVRRLESIALTLLLTSLIIIFLVNRQNTDESNRLLANSESNLSRAQEVAHLGNWLYEVKRARSTWSEEVFRIFGLDSKGPAPSYLEHRNLIHPDDWEIFDTAVQNAVVEGTGYRLEVRIIRPDGSLRHILSEGRPVLNRQGETVRLFGTIQDVTERKQAEEMMLRLAAIVESSDDAIISQTLNGTIISWNSGAEKLYGYSSGEVIGRSISLLVPPEQRDELLELLGRVGRGESIQHFETLRRKKDGTPVPVSITISPIRDTSGRITGGSTIARDITERKRMEEALRAMSLTDELTGFYNRRGFITLGQQALKVAARLKRPALVLFGDLDNMKKINDTLGHNEGDAALKDLAGVFRLTFRDSDLLARIGGDEFVALAIEGEVDVEKVIKRVRNGLAGFNAQGKRPYKLEMSIGTARFDPEKPEALETLLDRADQLMYEQKRSRKSA